MRLIRCRSSVSACLPRITLTVCSLLAVSAYCADAPLPIELPNSGVLHLVYSSPGVTGDYVYWIDFATDRILFIKGASVTLREQSGRYLKGSVFEDFDTARLGTWTSETENAKTLLGQPNPVVQAVVLRAEHTRVDIEAEGDGSFVLTWNAPPSTTPKYSDELAKWVDEPASERFIFHVSADGRVRTWQYISALPAYVEGRVAQIDWRETQQFGTLPVPRFQDPSGKALRPPHEKVFELKTAEWLEHAPAGTFDRDGAIRVAAEAAGPMLRTYRESFYWHDSERAADQEQRPFVGPTAASNGPSWNTAFITAGVLVLGLGVFAWWRSRR